MRVVGADTGPLNYLVLIDQVGILPALFGAIFIPEAVRRELRHAETPASVRRFITTPPTWLTVEPAHGDLDPALRALDVGEGHAIALASDLNADLVLMDDRAGVAAARARGFAVTGTLGLIDLGGRRGLLDVAVAVARLRATSFRCRPDILDDLLGRHQA